MRPRDRLKKIDSRVARENLRLRMQKLTEQEHATIKNPKRSPRRPAETTPTKPSERQATVEDSKSEVPEVSHSRVHL